MCGRQGIQSFLVHHRLAAFRRNTYHLPTTSVTGATRCPTCAPDSKSGFPRDFASFAN